MRPTLEAKWSEVEQRVVARKTAVEARRAQKDTPQYELTQLGQKMATFQRRIKLYTTKMKKLQRRKRHLEKKIAECACLEPANP
jgi:predicted  nucleic acid-binding Zn-ribbon protein